MTATAAPGIVTGGSPPNAVVQIQPGMNVQPVVLVDQNGNYITSSGGTAVALATTTTPVNVSNAAAPVQGLVLTATSGTAATWQATSGGTAVALASTSTAVNVSNATAPTSGQVLTATSGTAATWQVTSPTPFPNTGWIPADNNLLGACGALDAVSSTFGVAKGDQYMIKVPVRSAFTAGTVWTLISIAGTGTSTGSYAGLMNSGGTVLTSSSDCVTQFTSSNAQQVALTTPQNLASSVGSFVWVLLLSNLSTAQPTFRTVATASSAIPDLNLTAATYRAAQQGAGTLTTLTTVTPSSNSATDLIWVGLS